MIVNGLKILITERNGNIRDLLRREFKNEGFLADAASDVAGLRERLQAGEEYALVVLDEDLPGAGDEPALGLIARLAPDLPVILHIFPGADRGEEADRTVRLVQKSGDFDCLKRAVLEIASTRAKTHEGELDR